MGARMALYDREGNRRVTKRTRRKAQKMKERLTKQVKRGKIPEIKTWRRLGQ